jgi:F-type H+-transporting ATPase subunit b
VKAAGALGIAGLALGVAAPARASSEGSGAGDLVWMALNLAILLGVLIYFGRKPVRAYFADRRHRIHHELTEAEQLRSEVEARLAQWQRKLTGLDAELERLRRLTLEQAETERDRILGDARAAAERIRRDAQAVIDQELRRSRDALRAEAAELTVRLAGDLLSRQVTDADRERLVDEFIQGIEQAGARRANGEGQG